MPQIRPCLQPDAALQETLQQILQSGRLSNGGPQVQRLDRELAALAGVAHAVAVCNGWAALVLALQAVARPGTAVVLPGFTFVATRNAVTSLDLEPVFCDVDAQTWTLDPAALAAILAKRADVAAVVAVTVFGVRPPLQALAELCRPRKIPLVVDDAHGAGVAATDDRALQWADAAAWSLHATKTVPAGEGGAVLLHTQEHAVQCRSWTNHGIAAEPLAGTDGYNFKLSELHAAVGLHSIATLPARQRERARAAEALRSQLQRDHRWQLQEIPAGNVSNHQNVVALWRGAADSLAVIDHLRAAGIEARRYFWPLPNWLGLAHRRALPICDDVGARTVSLPIYDNMTDAEVGRICAAIAGLP